MVLVYLRVGRDARGQAAKFKKGFCQDHDHHIASIWRKVAPQIISSNAGGGNGQQWAKMGNNGHWKWAMGNNGLRTAAKFEPGFAQITDSQSGEKNQKYNLCQITILCSNIDLQNIEFHIRVSLVALKEYEGGTF